MKTSSLLRKASLAIAALCVIAPLSAHRYVNPTGDQFPLMAWGIDMLKSQPDSFYYEIAASGCNLITRNFHTEESLIKVLDKAGAANLRVMPNFSFRKTPEQYAAMARRFKENPHFAGFYLYDEPKYTMFPQLKVYVDSVYSVDTSRNVLINLLPWVPEKSCLAPYEKYVEELVPITGAPLLSYDSYPLTTNDGETVVSDRFYYNLNLYHTVSEKQGVPFWAFGLVSQHFKFAMPNADNLRFETFSALAYGAQGISYYRYVPISYGTNNPTRIAPVDSVGGRTYVWYDLREVNAEIQRYAPVFLGCRVVNVGHVGNVPFGANRLTRLPEPFRKLRSGRDGILFSHVRNNGHDYFVIVNHNPERQQKVRFSLSAPLIRLMPDGTVMQQKSAYVELDPGGYAIFSRAER